MPEFKDVTGEIFKVKGCELEALSFEKLNGKTYWIFSCKYCETRDPELWYKGSIRSLPSRLSEGHLPCSCGGKPQYTSLQKEILTKRYAESFGYTFVSRDEGTVNKAEVLIKCLNCAKDPELFGEGLFRTTLGYLKAGKTPCPCKGNFRYNENQYKVLCKRKCKELNLKFLGWEGGYNKGKSKPKVSCNITRSVKYYKDIDGFLNTKVAKIPLKLLGHSWEGCNGNTLEVVEQNGEDLKVVCSICKNHPERYPSTFNCKAWQVNRRKTYTPCGCSPSYPYSNLTLKSLTEDWISNTKLSVVSFPEGTDNWGVKAKVILRCEKGHVYGKSFDTIINTHAKSCKICTSAAFNGYYPDRAEEKDYLYLLVFNGKYIKVGRAFNVTDRLISLSRESGVPISDIKVLKVFTATHQEVYDTEQRIHEILEDKGWYHHESDWSTETFQLSSFETSVGIAIKRLSVV